MARLADEAIDSRVEPTGRLTLGYASGTPTHDADFATIAPLLRELMRQRDDLDLEIIDKALRGLDASRRDIVRTRMFVTDIERWAEFGRAHKEAFGDHPPTTTMVEVRRLIDPEMLIEVEADAVARPTPTRSSPAASS